MDVLDRRALNRALLARQSLLVRDTRTPLEMVEHLLGLQAQAPFPPYFGLWTRLREFAPDTLARLLENRDVVRIVTLRGTVHLHSAADALVLRPFTQPVMDRDLRGHTMHTPRLAGVDLDRLAELARAALAERPLANSQLAAALGTHWPEHGSTALAYAARNLLPLVQVPPRAVWGRSGQPTYATAEDWLGKPLEKPDAERVILRYLAAFGPASVRDVQTWCGLTRLGEVVEGLRPRLRTFRTPEGRELFDLPEAPRPAADTPAPVRFLPEFDNLLLSHADRTRVIGEDDRKRIRTPNGIQPAVFLVDGFVHGDWKIRRDKESAVLEIRPFRRLSRKDTAALTTEGRRLLRFAESADGDVRFVSEFS
ncbi:winged helix DNA-binding protein [Prauserella shujinwangii]|uniref:Winged helix DNA-binding protein n=1 Tax=Prauserella shujinwangii TaxID=1453103 RepID=A0A2T0LPU4_9PSEU|nr:winged helix DNA-binding domain-containing protein [Prauserella shujinwangii]PRX45365.1 winged helix DNA-binding protein [Prauserella shujinwangii]